DPDALGLVLVLAGVLDGEAERLLLAPQRGRRRRRLPPRARLFKQEHADLEGLAIAPDAELHPITRSRPGREPAQAVAIPQLLAFERGDDVPHPQPRAC